MIVYIVYEINYEDLKTEADDSISFCTLHKNKRRAEKTANKLINKAKRNNLYMDKHIQNKKRPFKKTNKVDFYYDDECQDYKVTSIGFKEAKLVA